MPFLSIFTTVTDPIRRGDAVSPAMRCYAELSDEVITIKGSRMGFGNQNIYGKCRSIYSKWPFEFEWSLFSEQFQKGYEACTGDWVIKMDIDSIFHEQDFDNLRNILEQNPDAPALSMWKYQFIIPDRYNLKSRIVFCVNKKKFGNRIRFDSGGDLCQVSLDGKHLTPDDVPETKIPIYNYEKMLKTREHITEDVGRMERAWQRHFGNTQYGTNETNYFEKWYDAQLGKFKKPQLQINLEDHPKYIQDTIKNLKPDQFGYNGFGLIEGKVYET